MIARAQNTPLEKVRVLQRSLYWAAKANPTRKFGVLYDKVCRDDVLRIAYLRVKANGGAPGVDHQTLEVIEKEIGVNAFRKPLHPTYGRSVGSKSDAYPNLPETEQYHATTDSDVSLYEGEQKRYRGDRKCEEDDKTTNALDDGYFEVVHDAGAGGCVEDGIGHLTAELKNGLRTQIGQPADGCANA